MKMMSLFGQLFGIKKIIKWRVVEMTEKKVRRIVSMLLALVWCLVMLTICENNYSELVVIGASLGATALYLVSFCFVVEGSYNV